jgi:hypothetical protein
MINRILVLERDFCRGTMQLLANDSDPEECSIGCRMKVEALQQVAAHNVEELVYGRGIEASTASSRQ